MFCGCLVSDVNVVVVIVVGGAGGVGVYDGGGVLITIFFHINVLR